MDTTKKGILLFCKICERKTRHCSEPDKKEKMVWFCCEECGEWELIDHWS
jgi:hypothetical protein